MPVPIAAHSTVVVGSVMYALTDHVRASMMKYDSTQDTWSEVSRIPSRRTACAACAVGIDVYAFGGYYMQQTVQASVFKYDTIRDE
jgi:hypothetical protein